MVEATPLFGLCAVFVHCIPAASNEKLSKAVDILYLNPEGFRYGQLTNVCIYSFNLNITNAKRGRLNTCLGTGLNDSMG